ncbi:hypothetical protein L227DRAFT_58618 [Lentinus tigrinus ALCF2SS1-6]|uniref:Uncharacterized protein n=1 Tax=Lentinus tigrinus ALCF2SS1-6 TaxID=1328759 RepID=A0A5C2SDE0_9APHY|nr:hypothetical protein L227DRAFT_58618 [Lentinus tigrinus ALCF2SS1-6]
MLRGTHSAIIPWTPPHGMPREVLCTMRERLLNILYLVIQANVVRPQSGQTSPARSVHTGQDRNLREGNMEEELRWEKMKGGNTTLDYIMQWSKASGASRTSTEEDREREGGGEEGQMRGIES